MRRSTFSWFVIVAALAVAACDSDSPDVTAPTTTYTVSFDLEEAEEPLGALQFDVEYRGGGEADWVDAGGGGACRWIVQAAIHACNVRPNGALTCAVVDTGGFSAPIPLLECLLASTDDALTSDDFDVRVTDASSPHLVPVDAVVNVSAVVASPGTTTTTTNPDVPPSEYDVVFALGGDDYPFPFTLLRLELTHEGVVGGWIGSGADVDCRWLVPADSSVCNEVTNRQTTCIASAGDPITAVGPILECGFATYQSVVETSDFSARVTDAETPYGTPDRIHVEVRSVTPR